MALVLQDRVKENSLSSGIGSVVLAGAYTGYRTFASCIPNGSTTYYCIHNLAPGYQDEWEVGLGTYTLSTTTLSRDTVLSSSAGGAKVNFTAGSGGLEVFITYPAEKSIYEQADGQTIINDGPITVIGSNVTTLPSFTAELGKFLGNINSFAQVYALNQFDGTDASADFVTYNNLATDGNNYFTDMGINSDGYNSATYPIFTPNSGYILHDGDNLYLGTQTNGKDTVIFAGGADANNTVATFGSDLSTILEGSLSVNTTMNVGGVAVFDTYAYSGANVAAAANSAVLVTKAYVDNAVAAGLNIHDPVRVERGSNLNATYNNGTAGVGATLTNAGAQTALVIDGITLNVADRVLVYGQTNAFENGVYTVTNTGSGSTNWVLTRATDADTYGANSSTELGEGSYFYVTSGNTGAGESYVVTTVGTITFGTTAITFTQFSATPTFTGGTNINISGQTISLTGTVAPTNGGTGVNTVATGDLLYGSASNTWSKLPIGASYKSLVVNGAGTQVEWNAVALNQAGAVSGTLDETHGGTGNSTYTTGDTLYASAANTLTKLAGNTTTTRRFLSQTGNGTTAGAPAWNQPAASDITGLAPSATTDTTNASNITSGTLANARTTASSSNGASTIVARDASGNFSANTITANVTGNISGSAASLTNAQNFQISGGVTAANVSFNGTAAVNLNVTAINASVINSGTIPNANTTASSSNGANTIVARDASGNFTAANVSATNFIGTLNGSGANVTTINASNITTGTLDNARTSASSSNGASTIVARDASGNFTGNTITAVTGFSGPGGSLTSLNASNLSSGTVASARVSGSYTDITGVGTLTAGTWNANAITDTYLATITTAGKVANSATTATNANGASTIVARDASGNFSGNTITAVTGFSGPGASLTGLNASALSSGTIPDARFPATLPAVSGANLTSLNASNISSGTVGTARLASGTANSSTFLRGDQTWAALSAPNNGTLTMNVSGTGLSGSATFTADQAGNSTFTVTSNASSSNGASTIVARDASGNFSANTITATLSGNATTATTATTANALNTGNNYQMNSLGVGTAASGTAGEIRATNNITAYFSDDRLKTRLGGIPDALAKLKSLEGFYYEPNQTAQAFGYEVKKEVGVSAQQVQAVMPEVVAPAPIDDKYLTVRYERLVPLLIEAIKELETQVAELKKGR